MGFFKTLFSGKNVTKKTPDYAPAKDFYSSTAKLTKDLGLDVLDWSKEQWSSQQVLLDRILGTQEGIADSRLGQADAWQKQYDTSFQPLEQQLVQDAQSYNSSARQELEAGRAVSQVGDSFEASRNNAQQRLESFGIDPSNTRAQALDANVRQQESIAKAAAANDARRYVEETGRNIRGQAIDLGQTNLNRAQAGYGDAFANSSGVLQNNAAGVQAGQNIVGGATRVLSNAGRFYDARNALEDQDYQNQRTLAAEKDSKYSNITAAIGKLAGMALGAATGGAATPFIGAATGALGGAATALGARYGTSPLSQQSRQLAQQEFADGGEVRTYANGGFVSPTAYDDNYANGVAGNGANRQSLGGQPNFASGVLAPGEGGGAPAGPADVRGWADVGTQDGAIEGPGGPKDDLIDAKLSDGEFVIPAEVVRRKGTEFFDKLVTKTQKGTPQAIPAGNAMVTTPNGDMGGAMGAIPMMSAGGYIQRRH